MTYDGTTVSGGDAAPAPRAAKRARGVFLFLGFLHVAGNLVGNLVEGGNKWKQGDWLINALDVAVRRGPFGSVLIRLSDMLGLSPLILLIAFQGLLVVALYLAFARCGDRLRDQRIALLLAVPSALFTVAWVADTQGALRKELLSYAALTLAALGVIDGRRALFAGASVLAAIAVWGHEALILFLPAYAVLCWLALRSGWNRAFLGTCAALVLAISSAALIYALRHPTLADPARVCQPLMARGLDAEICDGAIRWLGYDTAHGAMKLHERLVPGETLATALAGLLTLLPLVLVVRSLRARRFAAGLVLLAALPVLPLYVIAVDWGRWMGFQAFAASIVLMTGIATGALVVERTPRGRTVLILALLCISYAPLHALGAKLGGMPRALADEVLKLF